MVGGAAALSRVPGAPRLPCGHPPPLSHPRAQGGPLGPRGAPAPRVGVRRDLEGARGAGAAALPALVRSSTPRSPMSQLPLYLTPRPGRAAPLVRDLHRAQLALARQPAQGAARVPGRRRHGWHVRCMSFIGFRLYRSALCASDVGYLPPLPVPSRRFVKRRQKQEVTPRELRSSNASLPRAAPRLPRLPPPSSTLPTAVRAGLRNLHTAFNMGKGKGAPENPALAHAPDSSRAQLTLGLTPRFSSPGQVRASRSSRSPTTLARRSKHTQPVPPRCGAIIALAHPAPHLCRAAPCACILTLITHACRRALRAQEHEAAQGRVDGPLLGCPRALLERQGEPRRPRRAKSSREHQGHGGEGPRALRCALLVCRAGCHPQSRRSQSKIAPVAHVHYVKKLYHFFVSERRVQGARDPSIREAR